MKTSTAIAFYGNATRLADALKVSRQAISQWGEKVPPLRAYELERLTNGKLKAVEELADSDAA
ncbi:Cro/CI family transcriptional regulator [Gayadomonas joobiniege]|uniref:Cro/CI family transcriptional regulator n=1 Tax=Gayadomonas joobiniege TaxID=1234606 RepID=UPI0003635A9F|nr:Cro/CI family transcriptional regulator [Gayadomonas joobiniege]